MPTLLIRNPDGSQTEQALSGELLIGRADGNGLVLSEGGVSRRHARFFEQDGQLLVEDLGSANGTWVDGERIEGPTVVGPRAQIVIGDYELSLQADAPARPRPERRPRPAAPGSQSTTLERASARPARATRQIGSVNRTPAVADEAPGAADRSRSPAKGSALARRSASPRAVARAISGPTLRGLTGPWANKLYPLRDKVVVGRVAGVEIQIEDESVSRRHAELERTPEGVLVRDLNSANGTQVNGAPLEGELLLQPGDVVQVGMIELRYEVGDKVALDAPTRRPGARAGTPARRGIPGAEPELGQDPGLARRRKLLVLAGAMAAVLLVAGVAVKASGGGKGPGPTPTSALPPDPARQLQALLSECRTWASMEFGNIPNWEKADAACNKALDLDPIHQEAIQLIKRIRVEKDASKDLEEGERLMQRLREQEALEQFAKIPKDSDYYARVKPRIQEAVVAARKKAGEECRKYAKGGNWSEALVPCERYMVFVCQNMSDEELYAPPGRDLDVWGTKGRNAWRPTDELYVNFLRARDKKDPGAGQWVCPVVEMYRSDIEVVDPSAEVKRVLKGRFPEKLLFDAMMHYWDGNLSGAVNNLQRVREARGKAALHAEASELQKDISTVESRLKSGATQLRDRNLARAAEAFREAIRLDERLMKDLAASHPSFVRRTIERDVAEASYSEGKVLADRGDHRRACLAWKQGYAFYQGSPDINKAIGFCSMEGAEALKKARTCEDLAQVLDFHSGNDGLDRRVAEKKTELDCP